MKWPKINECSIEKTKDLYDYHCNYDSYRCLHSKLVEKTLIPREWKDKPKDNPHRTALYHIWN